MLRRMKEELSKQKGINASLQTELDGIRGTSPSNDGNRTRAININGRGTPLSDDGHDVLRTRLEDVVRQRDKIFTENNELKRQLEAINQELEHMREDFMATQHELEGRANYIQQLEDELKTLEISLQDVQRSNNHNFVEQLRDENQKLKRENEEFSQRIALLLEVDTEFGRNGSMSEISNRRNSHSSSDNAIAFENFSNELDVWQRQLASSRPLGSEAEHVPSSSSHQRLGSRS